MIRDVGAMWGQFVPRGWAMLGHKVLFFQKWSVSVIGSGLILKWDMTADGFLCGELDAFDPPIGQYVKVSARDSLGRRFGGVARLMRLDFRVGLGNTHDAHAVFKFAGSRRL